MYLLHICGAKVIWYALMYSEAWCMSGVLASIYVLVKLDNTRGIKISARLFGRLSCFLSAILAIGLDLNLWIQSFVPTCIVLLKFTLPSQISIVSTIEAKRAISHLHT